MWRYLKYFSLSVLLANHLFAQQLPFKNYTSKDGLSSDRITCIAQDEKGFMWFGSYFGICRYDGIVFEKIDLPPQQQNKYVSCLLSANKKMYAGFLFNGGLAEYDNGTTKVHFIRGKDSASANEFLCMTDNKDGSILLCNASRQLYEFRDGSFTHVATLQLPPSVYAINILKDKYNNIWIGTEQGLFILPYPYRTQLQYHLNENIFSMVKDQEEKIWLGRNNHKQSIIETCDGWQNGTLMNPVIQTVSSSIHMIPFSGYMRKSFWAIHTNYGLVNISKQKTTYYKVPLDFNSSIKTVFADRENNVWIANEPGILKVSNFDVRSYEFQETAAGGGTIQAENDSSIWMTNSKSLYHIDGDSIHKKAFIQPNPSFLGLLYLNRQNDLWIGVWNDGIWHTRWKNGLLESKKFFYQHRNKNIKAPAILEDSQGNMLVGGPNGIFRIREGKVVEAFHPLNRMGQPAVITCMALDEKNKTLWVGDNARGIIKIRYEVQDRKHSFKTLSFITPTQGLEDEYIRVLLTDHNHHLWVGTRVGGIYKIIDNTQGLQVINYNKASALLCNRITDIKLQQEQAIWFATCNGIYKYEYGTDKWTYYNSSHGLLNAEVYNIAVDSKNNLVWALTAQGVTRFVIDSREKAIAPLINIVNVNVLGKPDKGARVGSSNKFSYSKNSVGFHFTGSSFIDEKKIKYKYMLEGYDEEWSDPVTTNSVNYASLPPGSYLFKVMAQNAKGHWSDAPATFKFEIVRPFYMSPWFPFSILTVIVLIIYFIRVQRLKNRYKIEQLRMSISTDLHDDIGSTLSSISILSDIAAREKNHSQSQDMLQEIKHNSVSLMEKMDDIVWSINPGNDSIEDLMLRIKRFASKLLEAKEIDYTIIIDDSINKARLDMETRQHIYLIMKEAINNLVKYSDCTKACIGAKFDNNYLNIEISDNGKGFNQQKIQFGNGIISMKKRAEAINATIKIDTRLNKGTIVSLQTKIK